LTPEAVVQRQLDSYNSKDLEAWLATYAEDAKQFEHPGKLLASGHAEIRARAAARSGTEPSRKTYAAVGDLDGARFALFVEVKLCLHNEN
jgi:hypothetical protein